MKILKYYVDEDVRIYSKEKRNDLFWIQQALDSENLGYELSNDECYDMWEAYSNENSGGYTNWLPVPRNNPEAIIAVLVEDI